MWLECGEFRVPAQPAVSRLKKRSKGLLFIYGKSSGRLSNVLCELEHVLGHPRTTISTSCTTAAQCLAYFLCVDCGSSLPYFSH